MRMLESGPGVCSHASIAAPRSPSASAPFTASTSVAGMILELRMERKESMISATVAREVRPIMIQTILSIALPPVTISKKPAGAPAASSCAKMVKGANAAAATRYMESFLTSFIFCFLYFVIFLLFFCFHLPNVAHKNIISTFLCKYYPDIFPSGSWQRLLHARL